MSAIGHRMTAASLATAGFIVLPTILAVMFAAGCMAGARAPDWLEITWFRNGRNSLIPHRTFTHWPLPWIAGLLAVILLPLDNKAGWPLIGFLTGGLLHLATDMASPTGIPLRKPFGRRFSLNLYRTGGPGEFIIVTASWFIPGLAMILMTFLV